MENVVYILLAAFLSGVIGTGLGGLVGVMFPRISPLSLKRMLSATAGLMLAIVCFELLPESMEESMLWGSVGLIAGIMGMLLLSPLVREDNEKLRTGKLVGAGIALHNFPEGLAIGAGMAGSGLLGATLALTIALHDIPEGVAMALPLREGGTGRKKAVLAAVISGIPTVLGAAVGIFLGGVSQGALAFSLGLAGGAMLEVTCCQLLPESTEKKTGGSLMAGLLFGAAICFLLHGSLHH